MSEVNVMPLSAVSWCCVSTTNRSWSDEPSRGHSINVTVVKYGSMIWEGSNCTPDCHAVSTNTNGVQVSVMRNVSATAVSTNTNGVEVSVMRNESATVSSNTNGVEVSVMRNESATISSNGVRGPANSVSTPRHTGIIVQCGERIRQVAMRTHSLDVKS
jgi:hypothetical protein